MRIIADTMQARRLKNTASLLLASTMLLVAACQPQTNEDAVSQPPAERPVPLPVTLDAYMNELESEGFSGVVLVALNGEIAYRKAFGFADCDGLVPMTPDHLLLIGSITKELTQILAYKLAEEGHLDLDDSITEYFPELAPQKTQITVRQLVNHRAGLPDLVNEAGQPVAYSLEYDYQPVSRDEMVARVTRTKLIFKPGAREEYSNLGYDLLAGLLEVAAGESYEQLLQTRIFEPAGMNSIGYTFPERPDLQFADGCRRDGSRWGSPVKDDMWGADGPSWNLKGAGGLIGRADDLAAWFDALKQGEIFESETQAAYLDDRLVFLESLDERAMGPAGSNGIFNAVAFWTETSDMRVVVLSNRAEYQAEEYARDIIRTAAAYR